MMEFKLVDWSINKINFEKIKKRLSLYPYEVYIIKNDDLNHLTKIPIIDHYSLYRISNFNTIVLIKKNIIIKKIELKNKQLFIKLLTKNNNGHIRLNYSWLKNKISIPSPHVATKKNISNNKILYKIRINEVLSMNRIVNKNLIDKEIKNINKQALKPNWKFLENLFLNIVKTSSKPRNIFSGKYDSTCFINRINKSKDDEDFWKIYNKYNEYQKNDYIVYKGKILEFEDDIKKIVYNFIKKTQPKVAELKKISAVDEDVIALDDLLKTFKIKNKYIKILRKFPIEYLQELSNVYNSFYQRMVFPNSWNQHEIIYLFKNNNHTLDNCRFVYKNDNVFGIIFQKILYNKLEENCRELNLFQECFHNIEKKCVSTCLEELDNYIKKNNCTDVVCVLLDIEKAFDNIDINILYKKMLKTKISIKLINTIIYYLNNVSTYININNQKKQANVYTKVLQGCPLATILFTIYINDIPTTISKKMVYVDDIILIIKSDNIKKSVNNINKDLVKMHSFFELNKLKINNDKIKTMVINKTRSYKKIIYNKQSLCWNESIIFLGLTIDQKYNFKKHIDGIYTRLKEVFLEHSVNKVINNLQLNKHCEELIINNKILPHLILHNQIWFNLNKQLMKTMLYKLYKQYFNNKYYLYSYLLEKSSIIK